MNRVGMDLVTVAASSVGQQSVVSPHGSIVTGRSSGVGAGVITEPIYVDSVGGPTDDLSVSSTPPGLQLTTITVAVPAGPLSPSDHNMGASVGGIPVSVSGIPNAGTLLHSAPLPTVPLPVVPAPPHECATLKWKHESPTKEKNASGGGLVSFFYKNAKKHISSKVQMPRNMIMNTFRNISRAK